MLKAFGKVNDLRTEEGKLTKQGYIVLALFSLFGIGLFLLGRYIYGKNKR